MKNGEKVLSVKRNGVNGFDLISWTGKGKNVELYLHEVKAYGGRVPTGKFTSLGLGKSGTRTFEANVAAAQKAVNRAYTSGRIDRLTRDSLIEHLKNGTAQIRLIGQQGTVGVPQTEFPTHIKTMIKQATGMSVARGRRGIQFI
jgi:hypothetical protein